MRRVAIALLLLTLGAAGQVKPSTFRSDAHGFRIRYPEDWSVIPVRSSEKWIRAKFIAPRDDRFRVPEQNATGSFRATLRVIEFPEKAPKPAEGEIRLAVPYRDYRDYLKRHYQGGGFHFSREDEIEVGKIRVTFAEVAVDKLTPVRRRLVTYIYHLEGRDLAVEVDVLDSTWKKYRGRLMRSLRSLREVDRKVRQGSSRKNPGSFVPRDRKERIDWVAKRRDWRQRNIDEALASLPKGWKVKKKKGYIVLTNAGTKYTAHITRLAGSVRKWLDRNFGAVGDGVVMPSLIRICESAAEANAYLRDSNDCFAWDTGEIVCAEKGGMILMDFAVLADAMLRQYLSEKDPFLWTALPSWLEGGLSSYVGSAFPSKSRGLVFPKPRHTLIEANRILKEGRMPSIRDILAKEPPIWDEESRRELIDTWTTSQLFVRYLLERGEKKGRSKGLMKRWMSVSVKVLQEQDDEYWSKVMENHVIETEEPMTEEEEERQFERRRSAAKKFREEMREERQRLLDQAFAAVFSDWTERDWKQLQKQFESWVKIQVGR